MKESTEKETKQDKTMADMADKALKSYEQIVRTGLKLQEEAGRCWSSLLTQSASAQDLQKPLTRFNALAGEIVPEAQKRMQEVLDLWEKNARTGIELMKKAAEAAQTPVIGQSQSKWMDVWTTGMGASRANVEALMQVGSRSIDSWMEFVQKNTEASQVKGSRTA